MTPPVSGGYFRIGEENVFPWSCQDRATWYFTLDMSGAMTGYTPSKTNKKLLIDLLSKRSDLTLFGVWTGKYSTSIFVLGSKIAVEKLREVVA